MSILSDRGIIEENDQTRAREQHLEALREIVGNVYPNKFERSRTTGDEDTITAIVEKFSRLAPKVKEGERPSSEELERINEELKQAGTLRTSGRIATPPRVMGKAAFVHLSDGEERLQIYVRKQDAQAISNDTNQPVDDFDSGWKVLQLLDHGDFIGVEGNLFVTKTGELSIHVEKLQFLSKALLSMPDKVHGLTDPEIRQRQRYVDLIASSLKVEKPDDEDAASRELSSREVFTRRSRLIREMRRYLDEHGYIEVETPMLSPKATGAAAKPFVTHHNALDIDLYARIAPELYLKRLLVGGFERVYELNRNFRNEGISTRHNPEFTMLEFYTAYKDVNWMMDFCEEMIRTVVSDVTRTLKHVYSSYFPYMVGEIDFGNFRRLTMVDAVDKYLPEWCRTLGGQKVTKDWLRDPFRLRQLENALPKLINSPIYDDWDMWGREDDLVRLQKATESVWTHTQKAIPETLYGSRRDDREMAQQLTKLFETVAETKLFNPTFIYDFPKAVSPLSKASPDDPTVAERFELYVAGMEVANGFSELNDPEEQLKRFEEQMEQRERGDEEAMVMDEDYIRALSYGMPPAAGIGIGIDRLTMLLTNRQSIRDVILFPHMRPQRKSEDKTDEEE